MMIVRETPSQAVGSPARKGNILIMIGVEPERTQSRR